MLYRSIAYYMMVTSDTSDHSERRSETPREKAPEVSSEKREAPWGRRPLVCFSSRVRGQGLDSAQQDGSIAWKGPCQQDLPAATAAPLTGARSGPSVNRMPRIEVYRFASMRRFCPPSLRSRTPDFGSHGCSAAT